MKSRIEVVSQQYQEVVLQNFDASLEQCKVHVLVDLKKLDRRIQERLEWSDLQLLKVNSCFRRNTKLASGKQPQD